MIITLPWLKEHLKTKANESEIIDKLTNIGLEVEGIKENSGELKDFKIVNLVNSSYLYYYLLILFPINFYKGLFS